MSTEVMRKEFEVWAESRGLDLYCSRDSVYEEAETQWAWSAWKASRAALVVALPLPPKAQRSDEEATFSAGGCDMLRKCQKALESAGITVKP